jgi:hypothetical protein
MASDNIFAPENHFWKLLLRNPSRAVWATKVGYEYHYGHGWSDSYQMKLAKQKARTSKFTYI